MAKREKRRSGDRKYHYTYLITDHINNKYYYGVHSTDFDPEDIEQYHSSSKHLKLLIRELGIENFSKAVRRYFNSRAEADAWEHKVLRRLKVNINGSFYNQSIGGVGYTASGHLTVKDKKSGKALRVPVDDSYIGVLYDCNSKGRRMTDAAKKHLSSLYKGVKWVGEENPVHYLKYDENWIRKISEGNQGRKLELERLQALKQPDHYKHLADITVREGVRDRMNFMSSINNVKFNTVYLFDGEVYTCKESLPVDIKNKYIIFIEEKHPLVDTLVAGGSPYINIKSAAESLGVHNNTIANRINSEHNYWSNYYFLDYDVVISNKNKALHSFRNEMRIKYKDILEKQKLQVKPFSSGMSDEETTAIFMKSGDFLPNTTFTRLPEMSVYKNNQVYNTYGVWCPVCSVDEYVDMGLCNGIFKTTYTSLCRGEIPCRCGALRTSNMEPIYTYHIKELINSEQCTFISLNGEFIGKKETKFIWKCRSGNIHNNTRIGLFLEGGSRCICCKKYYRENPPIKINLKDIFAKRKAGYLA